MAAGNTTQTNNRPEVFSSVMFKNRRSDAGSITKLFDEHRDMTQHQITVIADEAVTGTYEIRLVPDFVDPLTQSAATGVKLKFNNSDSAVAMFAGIFRGIELRETVDFTPGNVPMIAVLSSTVMQA